MKKVKVTVFIFLMVVFPVLAITQEAGAQQYNTLLWEPPTVWSMTTSSGTYTGLMTPAEQAGLQYTMYSGTTASPGYNAAVSLGSVTTVSMIKALETSTLVFPTTIKFAVTSKGGNFDESNFSNEVLFYAMSKVGPFFDPAVRRAPRPVSTLRGTP